MTVEYRIEHDPWANESIEYDLSGDEQEATRALDVEFDITVVLDILERMNITVNAYTLEYDRHTGRTWSILAQSSEEKFLAFDKIKHPYVTLKREASAISENG